LKTSTANFKYGLLFIRHQQEVLRFDNNSLFIYLSQTVEQQTIHLFWLEDRPYLKLALLILNMVCYSSDKGSI
jgi:hypothetical protein